MVNMNFLTITVKNVKYHLSNKLADVAMRSLFCLLVGSVLLTSGCADRPELPPSAYGTILEILPVFEESEKPFPFPMEGDNDHQNCVFEKDDF